MNLNSYFGYTIPRLSQGAYSTRRVLNWKCLRDLVLMKGSYMLVLLVLPLLQGEGLEIGFNIYIDKGGSNIFVLIVLIQDICAYFSLFIE